MRAPYWIEDIITEDNNWNNGSSCSKPKLSGHTKHKTFK